MSVGLADRFKSLGQIASLVNSGSALPEVLERITIAVCQRSNWSSSAIMAIDEATGYSILVARYDPLFTAKTPSVERWELATSPTRIALEAGRSIIIEDAQTTDRFPGYRREALERDYRTVVLLPFSAADEQGRSMVMSVHAHDVRVVDGDEVVFLETVAHLASLAVEKAHRLRLEEEQTHRLRQVLAIHNLAMEQVLADATLGGFAALCERHLHRPFVLVDLTTNQVIGCGNPMSQRIGAEEWSAQLQRQALRPLAELVRQAPVSHFHKTRAIHLPPFGPDQTCEAVIEPCIAAGATLGGIVLFTGGRALDAFEALSAEELRFALSVLLLREQIRFDARAETHAEFFSRLFSGNWRDRSQTVGRAGHLGLSIEEPARLAVMHLPGSPAAAADRAKTADIERALARLARRQAAAATAFFDGEDFVVVLPEGRRAAKGAEQLLQQMLEEVQWLVGDKPTACLSRLCVSLEDYRAARQDCARVLGLAQRVGRRGFVHGGDFGPLARLIAIADPEALRRFVEETLGAVERSDRKNAGALLATADAFLATGSRYQEAADRLGIHVTTLRYRLRRLSEQFGIDLQNPETRVALEIALKVRDTLPAPD